jgi:hypothetical protein
MIKSPLNFQSRAQIAFYGNILGFKLKMGYLI